MLLRNAWLRKVVGAGVVAVGAILALNSGPALAQAPGAAAKEARKIYTNKTLYNLPVQIDQKVRTTLREVALYVKIGSADWVRQETGAPHTTAFSYRAGQDGEYWFSLVLVDKNGRQTPADLNKEPPLLQVVVDTHEPVVDLQPWMGPDNETLLRCTIQDANPDYQSPK